MEDNEQKDVGVDEPMISENQVDDENQNGHGDDANQVTENQDSDEMVTETTKKEDEDLRKLFVGNLSWETKDSTLKEYLKQFGEILDCVIKVDLQTGRSRGFGFVIFKEVAGLKKALENRPHNVDGRDIDSKLAVPQKKKEKIEKKLFVGGVKPETSEDTIKEYFSKFGKIASYERPYDQGKDQAKGFCFLTFEAEGTVATITGTRYHDVDGKQVECKFADPPSFSMYGGGGRGRGGGQRGRRSDYSAWNTGYGGMGYGGSMGYTPQYFGGDAFSYGGSPYPSFGGGGYGGGGAGMNFGGGSWGGYDGGVGFGGGAQGKQGRGRRGTNFRPY